MLLQKSPVGIPKVLPLSTQPLELSPGHDNGDWLAAAGQFDFDA
jgi:hypothetical protein